ncbi:MAG: pilus assembly PilX N-terminal domain-containing protein [Desulfobacterales bacterium]
MRQSMRDTCSENGSVLVVTLMVLALLSIVAFSAVRSSTTEVQIAGNELQHQKYFFTAEAGLDHALRFLEKHYQAANALIVQSGEAGNWNFSFSGTDQMTGTSDDAVDTNGDGLGSHAEGAVWIDGARIDGVSYRITLWNNDDSALGGSFDDDRDGLVWIRSEATGPKGGGASVQMLLQGESGGLVFSDYTAQAGNGAGQQYTGSDVNPITDFSRQL